VGKWHLGDEAFFPEHHGFDVNIGGCHWGHPHKGHFSPWHIQTLPDAAPGTYLADHLTDRAIELMKNRERTKPFFLNLWHYAVHTPVQAPADLIAKYERKAKALGLDKIDALVQGERVSFETKDERHVVRRLIQSNPIYAAMMENLDTNIGRLLDAMEAEGLTENTVVVFTSDNGGLATAEGAPTCNHPLAEGKGWAEEGGNRVCQIVRWPKRIASGQHCNVPVTSTDFYPTFLECAGLAPMPEQHVDGCSILPIMTGSNTLPREAIFWHYPHYSNQGGVPSSWVVAGEWKLIEYFETGRTELFNLVNDPSEANDLSQARPDIQKHLHGLLQAWRADVAAKIPERNPNYVSPRPKIPNNAHE
jgi:arylsulfatase A-like enzyme